MQLLWDLVEIYYQKENMRCIQQKIILEFLKQSVEQPESDKSPKN